MGFRDVAARLGLGVKAPVTQALGRVHETDALGQAAGPAGISFDNSAATGSIIDGFTGADLYRTQPHLRTVVSFVARNGAQLGRHVYKRTQDGSRERVYDSTLAELLSNPNDYMTGYDLFNSLFSELAIYDFAIWVPVFRDDRWQIDPIPGSWVIGREKPEGVAFGVKRYKIQPSGAATWYYLDAKDAVVFHGYGPDGKAFGASPIVSLKHILNEQIQAYEFRTQMWKRGGRVGLFLSRPKDTPWSKEAQTKFMTAWRAGFSGSGGNAGSTPLLEDGMELKSVRFNAREEQWLEAATLSLSTVASAYHVPPSMVGVQGASSTFASVKEFRKMLYTETLGPAVSQVEDTINLRLAPIVAEPKGNYFELNIQEKLQGDFEEQAAQLFQAVGGPYMTPAEARKIMNLPHIDGTDQLLAPLNMGAAGNSGPAADQPVGDQTASDAPAPDATPPKRNGVAHGAHIDDGERFVKAPTAPSALEKDLKDFFDAQRRVVLAGLSSKDPSWWDQKRWNRELSSVLYPHLLTASTSVARQTAKAKGLNPDAYSVGQTENFLKAVADSRADLVNATTRDHYAHALEEDVDPETVYEDSESRAKTIGGTIMTFVASWAAVETVKQLASDKRPRKTWVSSGLDNSRHADMDGETVPIDEPFSNGAMYPGDPVLGAEGVANCGCGVDVDFD